MNYESKILCALLTLIVLISLAVTLIGLHYGIDKRLVVLSGVALFFTIFTVTCKVIAFFSKEV